VIGDLRTILCVGDLDIITALAMVPVSTRDLMLRLDVVEELVFAGKPIEIVENFLASRINACPIEFWLE
jgi:hypothetical protein